MVKLATLLAEFLYTHKRLDLPGIGSFLVGSGVYNADSIRATKIESGEEVHFENNTRIKEVPDLVNFIAKTTGKIKALAAADLDSHLELAKQFLNIGKPFLFEGIGTLTKQQAGSFNFVAGAMFPEKIKEQAVRESGEGTEIEEPVTGFKTIFYNRKANTNHKKTISLLLMLAGLAFAIWGGYTIYKKTISGKDAQPAQKSETTEPPPVKTEQGPLSDTTSIATPPIIGAGNYKFIVETADKIRALKRYSLLKGYGINIRMETTDSTSFRLFFVLPASFTDTTRVLDSLQRFYTPPGQKAYIEK